MAAPAGRVGSGAPGVVRAARLGGRDTAVVGPTAPAAGGRSHAVRTETLRADRSAHTTKGTMGKSAWYQVDTSRVYAASPAPPKEPVPDGDEWLDDVFFIHTFHIRLFLV